MNELLARMAAGEEAAFTECYDAYADRLYRYVVVRLRRPDDSADVLQNVFVRLVKYRQRIGQIQNLTTYLFRIAHNEADRYRERVRMTTDSLPTDLSDSGSAELRLDNAEAALAALNRLSLAAREVVELKIFAGCTFHEIGEILQIPQGTAATRYRQALLELRQWFAKEELL